MNLTNIKKDWKNNKIIYLMLLPVIAYFIVFSYAPMAGIILAFERYTPKGGVFGSPWVGLRNFTDFFGSYYFVRLLKNTFLISFYDLIFAFPAPIIFALLLNEVRLNKFKKVVQTVSYMPHFISVVVVSGIIIDFFSTKGIMTSLVSHLGGPNTNLLNIPQAFRSIFVGTNIWQNLGFNSIIYIAALSAIDQEQYEAAGLDGAGRFKQMLHITLPGIATTIIIMFILRLGQLMTVNFEKVILLYNPVTYETADVISSFVYRKGIVDGDYSYSTAVGLFNSMMNLAILLVGNYFSRKFSETSLF